MFNFPRTDERKTQDDVAAEGAILNEMLEIVAKRDSLIAVLEEDRQRCCLKARRRSAPQLSSVSFCHSSTSHSSSSLTMFSVVFLTCVMLFAYMVMVFLVDVLSKLYDWPSMFS